VPTPRARSAGSGRAAQVTVASALTGDAMTGSLGISEFSPPGFFNVKSIVLRYNYIKIFDHNAIQNGTYRREIDLPMR
jgi:hypothetical protein